VACFEGWLLIAYDCHDTKLGAELARKLHRSRRADAVAVQEEHDLADDFLLGPAGNDPLGALRADSRYFS